MARRDTARTRLRPGLVAVLGIVASGALTASVAAAPPPTDPAAAPAAAPAAPAPEPAPVTTQAPAPTAAPPAAAPTTVASSPTTARATGGGGAQTPTPTTSRPRSTTSRTTEPARPTATTKPNDGGVTVSLPPSASSESLPQTSCTSVVHIGDSLSVGLDSAGYVGSADARVSVRYAAVGVRTLRLESSGGRSVIERLEGQEDGEVVAKRIRKSGFHGCWVIALGTNDAANVHHGSQYGYSERIDRMMAVIGDDPVLWVDTKTA